MDFARRGKKIIAIGQNYWDHIKELNAEVPEGVLFFLKPTTSYLKAPNTVLIPPGRNVHHEVELGLVIGKTGRDIKPEDALDYVSGYALALDITARDEQFAASKKGLPWTVSKGYDHFTPISEFIPKSKIADPQNIQLWIKVNDTIRQNENTDQMIFKIPTLISEVSKVMTLEENDLIITGTPKGVGPIFEGDKIVAGMSENGRDITTISLDVKERPKARF
ncbi:hypothetical protein BB560_000383 [Smittium megazygosporum]|uniref:Fumarylacetoacetase-like C-terminal domain-containing protein n=1 Tax=Smittium megazygosporum TaxID=133381 RepID=A0A2T9ZKJ9_9FUNG|nr:hypothetical protein BB560_000383 [Smittium megazygosporum]